MNKKYMAKEIDYFTIKQNINGLTSPLQEIFIHKEKCLGAVMTTQKCTLSEVNHSTRFKACFA